MFGPWFAGLGVLLHALAAAALEIPSTAPREYASGERIKLKVNRIDSIKTQLPFDYYSLPFCQPEEIRYQAESLGEILRGDSIENSDYELYMRRPANCKLLCKRRYSTAEMAQFKEKVEQEYRVHWIVDNLPAATRVQNLDVTDVSPSAEDYSYQRGFALGEVVNDNRVYINNHVQITIKIRQSVDGTYVGNRIVGVEVLPSSRNSQIACEQFPEKSNLQRSGQLASEAGEVKWTYDVKFEESDIRWASRWDLYMKSTTSDNVHWFSIINSLVLVVVLAVLVATIMCRTLNSDIMSYNALDLDEEDVKEETGWKLVHGDVFRPPQNYNLLAALVGTGCQLYTCSFLVLVVACTGYLGPANRGALVTALLLFFAFSGISCGFATSSFYKMCKGTEWKGNVMLSAVLYPSIVAGVSFLLNLFIWAQGSSLAIPFGKMVMLLFLWMGVTVPLVATGAYLGLRRPAIELPCQPHQIPRIIPASQYIDSPVLMSIIVILGGGLIVFVPVFIEVFFILSSIWLHHYTYMFGFLSLVFIIMTVTCAEVAIVVCYFQLCVEDYQWWWQAFFTTGSSSIYFFIYATHYFSTHLDITNFEGTLLYFVHTGLASLTLFIVTGTVGVLSCLWFTKTIYASIKID